MAIAQEGEPDLPDRRRAGVPGRGDERGLPARAREGVPSGDAEGLSAVLLGKLRHQRRHVKALKKQQTDYAVPGVIPLDRKEYTPINKGTLNFEFHELERIAGVTPVPGRGGYGLRRLTSDLFE